MSLFRFPFGGSSRRNASTGQVVRRRRLAQSVTSSRFGSLGAEQLEGRALLAAAQIIEVNTTLPVASYKAGQIIPIQVVFDQPVTVGGGTLVCNVNVTPTAKADYAGSTAGGMVLNFNYLVKPGDNIAQFDVIQGAGACLFGGTIISSSTGLADADRTVANSATDPTITTWKPGLSLDTTAPVTPTVNTIYVNPLALSNNAVWAANHPDYFVLTGTAGSGPLAAGETLSVTVNGATYTPTVSATGTWEIRLVTVGTNPALAPTSGALAPWSPTDKTIYPVVAKVTDSAGNVSTATSTGQVIIDTVRPQVVKVDSSTAPGTYKAGDVLDIYIEYDEPVRVIGVPTLILNLAPVVRLATFSSVIGKEVHFTYTVQPGDTSAGFDYQNATALIVPGAIEDEAANIWAAPPTVATPALAAPGNLIGQTSVFPGKAILIDTTAPTVNATVGVASTAPNGTYYFNGPVVPITITYSEPIFVTGSPTLTLKLSSGATATATYAGFSGNVLTFNYTPGSNDDTSGANLDYAATTSLSLNGGTIKDVAGNDAVLALPAPGAAGSLSANSQIVVARPPRVTLVTVSPANPTGTYSAGQTIFVWVSFDKVVTVKAGALPYLTLNATPAPNVAQWNGNYVTDKVPGLPRTTTTTPTRTIQLEYLISPGDTTSGAYLNYTGVNDLKGAAPDDITYVFPTTGIAAPGYLEANLTLPAVTSSFDVLGQRRIVVGPDTTAPLAPLIAVTTDTTNDIANYGNDFYTSNPAVTVSGLETLSGTTWQYRYLPSGGVSSGWVSGGTISATGTATFNLLATAASNTVYPAGSIEVRQIDWNGNVSPIVSNSVVWTVDRANPAMLASATLPDSGVVGDGITNNGLVTVTGIEAAGLLQYNTTYSSATNSVTGGWISVKGGYAGYAGGTDTFTLPAGTYDPATGSGVVVRHQDLAGNPSPFTNVTLSGSSQFRITIDSSVAAPAMALGTDTTPGFAPYNGAPFTTDSYTSNGLVNVTGLEVANTATGQTGAAALEYNVGGGWVPATIAGSTGAFTLPQGTYAPGTLQLRETDGAGNQVTISNTSTWTVDQTAPTLASVTYPAGPFTIGQTITITATFSEPVYFSNTSPTLTLDIPGRVATFSGGGNGTSTMTFTYTVQTADASPALTATVFNSGTATIADKAGNTLANPVAMPSQSGPVVDAGIRVTSPTWASASPGLSFTRPQLSIPLVFNVPVRNFTIGAIKLYWNNRSVSLKGARLSGTAANYTLLLPSTATGLKGEYRLEINGMKTGVAAITGGALMTTISNLYAKRV